MGITERREREREEVRRKILDAARDLFATEGYANVTMRKIAEAIEYSPTTIYGHFEDKDDLVDALCHEDFARLLAVFDEQTPTADPDRAHPPARTRIRAVRAAEPEPLPVHVHDARQVRAGARDLSDPASESFGRLLAAVEEAIGTGPASHRRRDADRAGPVGEPARGGRRCS